MASGSRRECPVIAIDGPAGAGKSTLAAHLARRFGYLNLETGAMYRALALKAIENDFGFDEEGPLVELAGADEDSPGAADGGQSRGAGWRGCALAADTRGGCDGSGLAGECASAVAGVDGGAAARWDAKAAW